MKTKDNAGVYVPPPLIYAVIFILAMVAKSKFPIDIRLLRSHQIHILGWVLIIITIGILLPSLWRFWRSKNTLITVKPATSLQTTGIYNYTRNPMYLGLMVLYIGLACLSENCWTLIFLPVLFLIIQYYIIYREEKYLERAFGEEFKVYKNKVRRWI